MTKFELEYRKFERNTQSHQLSTTFHFTIEEFFETLETEDVDMTKDLSSTMIDPIANKNFGNNFHQCNVPNQCQHTHKSTCQQYQSRSFQILRNFSITYPKEQFLNVNFTARK